MDILWKLNLSLNAVCRDLSLETIEENLKAGKPYVLRLRSQGSPENEITFTDSKGKQVL